MAIVVGYARGAGKPLMIERLDFRQKKAVLEGESRKYSRMLSVLCVRQGEGILSVPSLSGRS